MNFEFERVEKGIAYTGDLIERLDGSRFFNPWTDPCDCVQVTRLIEEGLKVWRILPKSRDQKSSSGDSDFGSASIDRW